MRSKEKGRAAQMQSSLTAAQSVYVTRCMNCQHAQGASRRKVRCLCALYHMRAMSAAEGIYASVVLLLRQPLETSSPSSTSSCCCSICCCISCAKGIKPDIHCMGTAPAPAPVPAAAAKPGCCSCAPRRVLSCRPSCCVCCRIGMQLPAGGAAASCMQRFASTDAILVILVVWAIDASAASRAASAAADPGAAMQACSKCSKVASKDVLAIVIASWSMRGRLCAAGPLEGFGWTRFPRALVLGAVGML